MNKFYMIFVFTVFIAIQGSIYLGKCIGRDESKIKIETLEHSVDSLRIENAQIANDALLLKTKCELYEYKLWMK